MRGTTTRRLAALGTTVVLLAGCSGGTDPGATPSGTNGTATASSSTTTAATSTATSPSGTATVTIPAAARARTPEGAEAFASFFVQALNDAQVTTDASALLAISESECKGCRTFIEGAEDMRAKGHHVDRRSLKLDDLLVRPNSTDDRVNMDLLITESASNTVDARGKVIESFTSDRFTLRTTLSWLGTRWIVSQALLVAS